jgi:hypothetical protein
MRPPGHCGRFRFKPNPLPRPAAMGMLGAMPTEGCAMRIAVRRGRRPAAARRTGWYVLLACCASLASITGIAVAGPARAAPSVWSVAPAANRGSGTGQLFGVSCAGPRFCMAVGTFGGGLKNLAERWNGRAWSLTPVPSPGANLTDLDGVSCTSSSFCVAVGRDNTRSDRVLTLAEIWNGTKWSLTPTLSRGREDALLSPPRTGAARTTSWRACPARPRPTASPSGSTGTGRRTGPATAGA